MHPIRGWTSEWSNGWVMWQDNVVPALMTAICYVIREGTNRYLQQTYSTLIIILYFHLIERKTKNNSVYSTNITKCLVCFYFSIYFKNFVARLCVAWTFFISIVTNIYIYFLLWNRHFHHPFHAYKKYGDSVFGSSVMYFALYILDHFSYCQTIFCLISMHRSAICDIFKRIQNRA